MSKRATPVCIECGATKRPGIHQLTQRCAPCGSMFRAAMHRAHSNVRLAVSRSLIPPVTSLACVDCGADASAYDHRDYTKPLCVEPVCRTCNFRRGVAIWRTPDAAHSTSGSKEAA